MHNTNNNNTVYEDITLWSTERSCGVQARGVTTPKSIYTSVPMHTTTKTRMWAAAVHPCVCGCRAYVATYLLESVARKNSVKTHKFMNLCDFTKFFVKNQSNLQDLPPILNGYLWGNAGENSEKKYIILFVRNSKTNSSCNFRFNESFLSII